MKLYPLLVVLFFLSTVNAQEVAFPTDIRQHNVTEYNASLLNPAYALSGNNPSSIALWSRWQWQMIDADPTTIFLNYTAKINDNSAGGLGFFQNNTGIFSNSGAIINYAYTIDFGAKVSLDVGFNLFGYKQALSDPRLFLPTPFQSRATSDFILQFAPGINLRIGDLHIGLTSENIADYNFTTNERNSNTDARIFQGLASYRVPVAIFSSDATSYLQPAAYLKSIPGYDAQYGITTRLSTNKFWAQGGYNSYYGISGGVGGTFLERLSVGVLIEKGISATLSGTDPSIELVSAYKFGSLSKPKKNVENIPSEALVKTDNTRSILKAERKLIKIEQKAMKRMKKLRAKELEDKAPAFNNKEAKKIENDLENDASSDRDGAAVSKDSTIDHNLAAEEEMFTKDGERYVEVKSEGDLAAGYYLIGNVFGTKKYFNAFIKKLKNRGLDAGYFIHDGKYYVYLDRFDTLGAARAARDSNFNGRHDEKTWIFRVIGS